MQDSAAVANVFNEHYTNTARWIRDTPLSTKVGTKFRRQVTVAQSVQFDRGLRAMEFDFCVHHYSLMLYWTLRPGWKVMRHGIF
jgi:hypothetical protein